MTGSLQVKNDKFYMVLNSTENGKRKQKWISTGLPVKGNKRKAEQMLREKLSTLTCCYLHVSASGCRMSKGA